jgi:signal transduction histidine kinase
MDKERARTDRSLSAERKDSDKALLDGKVAERAADGVVEEARREADAVLRVARHQADQTAPVGVTDQAKVGRDRAQADSVVDFQRSVADERLRVHREEERLALAKLLPLEREHTDRDLLTERVRSNEAIESREDFLAIVSHDLRNLLRGVAFSSMSLASGTSDTEERKAVVATGKRIQHYAARMNHLIGDLVDVMSIDAGGLGCKITPGNPGVLLTETLATFREAAESKGITLKAEATGPLPQAAFDHDRMCQVFAHIVANALKFTARGGRVGMAGKRDGASIHFSVSDTGQGMAPDMLRSVFLRYWQPVANDPRGSGLGLYICKSIVEAHGGRIWAESTVGQGSTFHFTVPLGTGT